MQEDQEELLVLLARITIDPGLKQALLPRISTLLRRIQDHQDSQYRGHDFRPS